MNYSPVSLLAAVLTLASTPVYAGGSPTPRPIPHHGRVLIKSIDASTIVTETPHGKKTYKINERTEFYYKAHKTSGSDLSAGMRVVVTPSFGDPMIAAKIEADEAPKPDATPQK